MALRAAGEEDVDAEAMVLPVDVEVDAQVERAVVGVLLDLLGGEPVVDPVVELLDGGRGDVEGLELALEAELGGLAAAHDEVGRAELHRRTEELGQRGVGEGGVDLQRVAAHERVLRTVVLAQGGSLREGMARCGAVAYGRPKAMPRSRRGTGRATGSVETWITRRRVSKCRPRGPPDCVAAGYGSGGWVFRSRVGLWSDR